MNPQDPYQQPQPAQPPVNQPGLNTPSPAPVAPGYQSPQPAYTQPSQPLPPLPSSAPVQDPSQYPVDYLNQIAPAQRKKTLNKFAVFGLIFAVIAAAIFAVFVVMSSSGKPDLTSQAKSTQGRLITLQTVADAQQKHLTDNNLRATNTTLSSALTSMNSDLTEIMKKKAIKTSTVTVGTEKSYASKLTAKLDDAYLTGSLDRSYASEMVYQLALLKTQLKRLRTQANSKSITEYYDKNITSVDSISKQFADFAGSK